MYLNLLLGDIFETMNKKKEGGLHHCIIYYYLRQGVINNTLQIPHQVHVPIFKSECIIRVGPYVRHGRIAFFVNLGKLELSYRFQTLHGDSCSS